MMERRRPLRRKINAAHDCAAAAELRRLELFLQTFGGHEVRLALAEGCNPVELAIGLLIALRDKKEPG